MTLLKSGEKKEIRIHRYIKKREETGDGGDDGNP